MTQTPAKPQRSPRAERAVASILDAVGPSNEEAFKKALIVAMEHYVGIKKAEVAFATVFAGGLAEKDPVKLMAAVQTYRDAAAEVLGRRDEHVSSVLSSRPNEEIAHLLDRMTDGQFVIAASENMFLASHMHRELKDRLREVAAAEIENPSFENPRAEVKRAIAEMTDTEAAVDTPKPPAP